MPFIGKSPETGAFKLIDSITTSATATYALTVNSVAYYPASARNLIVSLNGVTQAPESAYTVSGSNIVFASALTASDVIDYILVIGDAVDIGTPSDNTVGTDQLASSIDLSGKTLTFANDQISGDAINGGTASVDTLHVGGGYGDSGATIYSTGNISTNGNLTLGTLSVDGSALIQGSLLVDNGTLKVDNLNNRVGIGEANPAEKLHISGTGTQRIRVTEEGSSNYAQFVQASSNMAIVAANATGDNEIAFLTTSAGASTEKMRIDSSGNVGIGTASPSSFNQVGADALVVGSGSGEQGITIYSGTANNGVLAFADGTTTTAQYQGYIGYNHSSNFMRFFTSATERMRIDSSGNVGIGTNPSSNLHVYNGANAEEQVIIAEVSGGYSNGAGVSLRRSGTEMGRINADYFDGMTFHATTGSGGAATERMRIDSSGNVGIGNTNPTGASAGTGYRHLDIKSDAGDTGGSLRLTNSDESSVFRIFNSDTTGARLGTYSVNGLDIYTDSTFRARFDHLGNLLIGTTSTLQNANEGIKLLENAGNNSPWIANVGGGSTNANTALSIYSTGAGLYRFYVGYGGTVYATSTSIAAISDVSLKENVRDLDKGLDTILALKPRRFDWINGDGNDIMGFIAQEVEEVLPELVQDYQYNEDETKKALKMGDMIPSLVKAIQEQQAIIEDLQTRLTALEAN